LPGGIQSHLPVPCVAENANPVLCADGDELGPCPEIIVALRAYGTAMIFFGIVEHPEALAMNLSVVPSSGGICPL